MSSSLAPSISTLSQVTAAELAQTLRAVIDAVSEYLCDDCGLNESKQLENALTTLDRYDAQQSESKPALSEVEQVAINVVRAHERFVSADMAMEFYNASAERSAAIAALGDALEKRGAL